MRVAIIHYWLLKMRGGEKVVEALCEMFPQADIFTHVAAPAELSETIRTHRIATTFIARLPAARRLYQKYLPLMPMALEELDLSAYDLVISSESGPAKGVIARSDAVHVCYCHSPMRYLWDQYPKYRRAAGGLTRLMMPPLIHSLRQWDVSTAARVDGFIANSHHVAGRIRKYYRREAHVIPPPVDVRAFASPTRPGEPYLFVSELVAYKRADLAVRAFTRMGKPLLVVGDGEERKRLEAMAGPTVTFLGRVPLDRLQAAYAEARALIFPGEEDFGIVPVEAMAAGRPVIAYGRGGILDSVVDGETGLFFHEQSEDALIAAVEAFERRTEGFDPSACLARARCFSREAFKARMTEHLLSFGVEPLRAAA